MNDTQRKEKWMKALRRNYKQVLLVLAAFIIMALVSVLYVGNTVSDQIHALSDQTMRTAYTAVSDTMNAASLLFSDIVRTSEKMHREGSDGEDILDYLRDVQTFYTAEDSPLYEFMKVYAYIGGTFYDGSDWEPPDWYDARERPWFLGAVSTPDYDLFFSEPYLDADSGDMCISFSKVISGTAETGYDVLAIDLSLAKITSEIRDPEVVNRGYGIFISNNFTFAVHKSPNLDGMNMTDAPGEYEKLQAILESGEAISAERFRDYDGTDSMAFFRTLFNGWYIGIVIPRSEYMQPVWEMALIISLVGVFLAAALSMLLVQARMQQQKSEEESLSKSSFLARMSHEMRTPMNAIIGMTEIAKSAHDPQKTEDCLEKISAASKHLLGVINDVLDVSKIEAGKLELSPAPFSFAEMLAQVETVVAYKFQEKNQSYIVNIAPEVPHAIVSDMQRLAQVITNLLNNAGKFSAEGGKIQLNVSRLDADAAVCRLQFDVIDNGIGISLENQAKLFQSFEQGDGSISRRYGGTGLGLVISKRIVELMNGEIHVESAPGVGSTFTFHIEAPIAELSETETTTFEETDEQNDFTGKRILLAEDVEINREIVLTLLADTNLSIDCAENGLVAYQMFRESPAAYDMILMDIHMPEMDGYEATRRIRALDDARAKTVPIVAMTANVFREDIEKCLAAGMNAHTGKPIVIEDVLKKLRQYLS